jgi:hypothetical protein
MALVINDRVRETTTVTGTNDATLLGAVTGFQAFSVIGNGNTTYYTISDQSGGNWEVGIGTFSSVGPTLARTTVLSSSAGGTKVSFPAGTKDVFVTYPSEKSVNLDESDFVIAGGSSDIGLNGNLTFNGSARRIRGDFSNATHSNRVLFQTTTTNGNTIVGFIPNGTSTTSQINLYNNSDPTNTSVLQLSVQGSTATAISSGNTGSGTFLPLVFNTNSSERVRITTGGDVGIGTAAPNQILEVSKLNSGGLSTALSLINPAPNVTASGVELRMAASSVTSRYAYIQATATEDVNGHFLRFGTNRVGATPVEQFQIAADGLLSSRAGIELGSLNSVDQGVNIDFHSVAGVTDYEARIIRSSGTNGQFDISNTGTGSFNLTQIGAAPMIFNTINAERMRITSAGKVGILTSAPTAVLSVNGTGNGFADAVGLYVYGGIGATTLDAMQYASEFGVNIGNNIRLLFATHKTVAGADWTTTAWRIQPAVDSSFTGAGSNRGYIELAFGTVGSYTGIGLSGSGTTTPDFIVDSAGNVGVGTLAPGSKVNIQTNANNAQWLSIRNNNAGSSATAGFLLGNDSNAAFGAFLVNGSTNTTGVGGANAVTVGSYGTNPFVLMTAGTERVRIDGNTGNVGIGLTNPGSRLSVFGGSQVGVFANNSGNAWVGVSDNNGVATANFGSIGGGNAYTYSAGYNAFFAGTSERMRIDSSGLVGIGTASPTTRLDVIGPTGSVTNPSYLNQTAVSVRNNFHTRVALVNGDSTIYESAISSYGPSAAHPTQTLSFGAGSALQYLNGNGSVAPTEKFRITSAGFVGINNSSPTQYLQVNNGALFAQGTTDWFGVRGNSQNIPPSDNGSNAVLAINGNYTGGSGEVNLWNTNATLAAGFRFMQKTGTSTFNDVMYMQGNNSRVGIATITPYSRLDVYGTTAILSPSTGEATGVGTIRITNGSTTLASEGGLEFKIAGDSNGYGSKIQALNSAGSQLVFATRNATATWTEQMRLANTGELGIGTTVMNGRLNSVPKASFSATGTTWNEAALVTTGSFGGGLAMIDGTAGYILSVQDSGGSFIIRQGTVGVAATERMRIDSSGTFFIGKSAPGATTVGNMFSLSSGGAGYNESVSTNAGGTLALWYMNRQSSTGTVIEFRQAATTVGTITVTGSATAYNTSSDYRLKENIAPLTGALAKVAQLKPCTYVWKETGDAGQGFIAHELQAVVPDAVTGEKDAVDEEGKPKYQGVDTSFLVATLTAAIQEQQTLIEQLTTRLNALEGK